MAGKKISLLDAAPLPLDNATLLEVSTPTGDYESPYRSDSVAIGDLANFIVPSVADDGAILYKSGTNNAWSTNLLWDEVAGKLSVLATTASTSTATGALVVSGGMGVAGALYVGGAARLTAGTASTSVLTGTLVVTGGVGVSGQLNVGSHLRMDTGNFMLGSGVSLYLANIDRTAVNSSWFRFDQSSVFKAAFGMSNGTNDGATGSSSGDFFMRSAQTLLLQGGNVTGLSLTSTTVTNPLSTASTSTTTGAFVVTGGVGIGGALNVGGAANVSGAFTHRRAVTVSAAGATLTNAQSGTLLSNEGASARADFNLPTAVAGLTYAFYVQDADGIRVTAATGDTIRIDGTVSASAGHIDSTTVGSFVRIVAVNATEWVAEGSTGTWTVT